MFWKETCPMDQKMMMIGDWLCREYGVTELKQIYGVSRKTVYKWINRYKTEGSAGLEERSRAPVHHGNATPVEIAKQVVNTKKEHQKWGPKKVIAWLKEHDPGTEWPVASTASAILKKEGLVRSRKRKRRSPPYTEPFQKCDKPNEVWSIDFKGQFRTWDKRLCYPLTVTDNCSRYLLLCRGLYRPTFNETRPWLEWIFREYGLPKAIKSDNGAPFASVGLGGLSRLSVWLIKLGIRPERIESGHPEQNGRHERMHRTLKEATADPPRSNMQDQQRLFDQFIREYNFERPNEAIQQKTPASVYEPSPIPYPAKIPSVEYSGDIVVRQVRSKGEIKWKGKSIYMSEALIGEQVGLMPIGERLWEIRFSFLPIGILDDSIRKVLPLAKTQIKVSPMYPV
jgi:transposase InsO family protein